jgi:hypothetical protein
MALPSRRGSAGWAFQFDGGQDGEFGELHCKLGHAVQIEPSLRPRSPKNGSFSNVRRRLSAISFRERRKSEPGDWWLIRKSTPLADLSASIRDSFSERLTGWLEREDSNSRIPDRTRSLREFSQIWEYQVCDHAPVAF